MGMEKNLAKWMAGLLLAMGLSGCPWGNGRSEQSTPRIRRGSRRRQSGSSIAGDVPVMGTAVIDPFQKYELYYKLEPSGDDAYIYFTGGTSPVVNGQLGTLNAAAFAPGIYTLRLRVVKLDGNYAEFFTPNVSINQGPAATPTPDESTEPTPTPIPTATFTPAPQPTPAVGAVAQPAALDAPLLPSPTPTTEGGDSLAIVVDPVQPAADRTRRPTLRPMKKFREV